MLDEFQREEALVHLQRGLHLERAHRVGEAVAEYRRALAYDPHLREAHDALGFYYQRHGLLAKAAEEFRVVATLENDFLGHFNLGCVLLELERHDEALAAFERCLALDPNDAASHYEIGLIHFLKGEYQAALDSLQLPLSQYPDDWELHQLVGGCQRRLNAFDEALRSFGAALRLAPRPTAQAEVDHAMLGARRRSAARGMARLSLYVPGYRHDSAALPGAAGRARLALHLCRRARSAGGAVGRCAGPAAGGAAAARQ